ncbi:hypothetical protein MMC11_003200 [Xylographa trunciseda]|nr:hypothetical protein [Xylographa trunciseda]
MVIAFRDKDKRPLLLIPLYLPIDLFLEPTTIPDELALRQDTKILSLPILSQLSLILAGIITLDALKASLQLQASRFN